MATIDLTNEITPKHPYRPVKETLSGLRAAIKAAPGGYTDWAGKGKSEERSLTSSNRSATVNLGGPQKRAEGATLRTWK